MAAGFQGGAFQDGAFQTRVIGPDGNVGGMIVATRPAGPAWTRKKFEEFLAAETAVVEAERKARALKRHQQRELAETAAAEARAAILAARAQQHLDWQQSNDLRAVEHAVAAFNSTKAAAETSRRAEALLAAARVAHGRLQELDNDDEEAIELLLLHE